MPKEKAEETAAQKPAPAVPVAEPAPNLGQIEADNYNRAAPTED